MPTSDITRLLAAITAVREAQEAFAQPMPIHERIYFERREALSTATNEFWKLATFDTIEAYEKVAALADEFAHKDTAAIINAPLLLDGRTVIGAWQEEFAAALATLDAIRPTPDQEGVEG